MNNEELFPQLVKLRGRDFLARTGDKKSVIALLEAIGSPQAALSKYSLDAVFRNPIAYRELMDPESMVRLKVIHQYSENAPDQAIEFSIHSLAQENDDLKLLALDVLDCNIAYLEKGIEIHLKKLLHAKNERVQVKASRLLVLLSNYESIDLSDCQAIAILEKALDSEDLFCRKMAFGMPASIFYKIKNVKSTIETLQESVSQKEDLIRELKREISQIKINQENYERNIRHYQALLENIEKANGLLQGQVAKTDQEIQKREKLLAQERKTKDELALEKIQIQQSLKRERKARAAEVEHARQLYEDLVADFQTREEQFKHNAYDFYNKFREIIKVLMAEKEELLTQLYRQSEYE